jgi:cation diffusion facilitator family transporter
MHRIDQSRWQHSHDYLLDSSAAERRTRIVIGITATMMVVEIVAGIAFNSMALLADGWHMSTHVAAFLITALAYHFSRRHRVDPRYSFGTGKMGVLGGFASAVVLSVIALLMAGESVHRFFVPVPIHFNQAIAIAVVGLLVNLVCALLFKDAHHNHHHHGNGHEHHDQGHHHHDLNLRAAYLHVLADALTSVTAIVALLAGKFFGWSWLDPVMGIVGSVVVSVWAYGLVRDTSGILLDRTPESSDLPDEIRRAVESDGDSVVTDLHVWQVGAGKFAAIVSIVAHDPKPVETYRELFREHEELVHVTIQVQLCHEHEDSRASV